MKNLFVQNISQTSVDKLKSNLIPVDLPDPAEAAPVWPGAEIVGMLLELLLLVTLPPAAVQPDKLLDVVPDPEEDELVPVPPVVEEFDSIEVPAPKFTLVFSSS